MSTDRLSSSSPSLSVRSTFEPPMATNIVLTNSTLNQCEVARSIIDPPIYQGILISECVVGLIAIIPNALLLSVVHKVSVFPPNLRLLLGHFSFVFLWYAIGSVIKSGYLLAAPVCNFRLSSLECKIMDLASIVVVLPNLFYNMVLLCIERLYASVRYKKYDKTAAKIPWLSFLLIIASWACAFGVHASPAFTMAEDEYLPTCESAFVPVKSATIYQIYLFMEILAAILTVVVFSKNYFVSKNMSINRARYDLSSRFQVDQNVRLDSILVPSMVLNVVCHIPTFVAMIGIRGRPDISVETKALLTQITYLWRLVYSLAHPLLAFRANGHFLPYLKNGPIGRLFGADNGMKSPIKVHTLARGRAQGMQGTTHFNYLNDQWERRMKIAPVEARGRARF